MFGGGDNERLMMTSSMVSPRAEMRGPQQQQPQWGHEETRDFIVIRGELEKYFTVAKRNKTLWQVVSAKMRERGYWRTPDQCKCKWKNLVNRYKGKETSDPENGRQCPFFEELHSVFTERAKNMQRLLLESETGATQAKKKVKRVSGDRSSDEFSEEDDDEDDTEEDKPARSNSRKRKAERVVLDKSSRATAAVSTSIGTSIGIQEMLKEFFQQQQRMEMQWREMMERRAHERQLLEQEWRQSMEKLERERLMVEQAWREREEQRRIKEESRAERRDALLTTLLHKIINENTI